MSRLQTFSRCVRSASNSSVARRSISTHKPNSARHVQYIGAAAISLVSLYYQTPRIHLDSSLALVDGEVAPDPIQASGKGLIPFSEVQKHNTPEDCWVVIEGKVYDLTEFAKESHPGGSAPINRVAGRDATAIFTPIHPPGTIENGLPPERCLGMVDPATLPEMVSPKAARESKEERKIELSEIIGLPDFDEAARRVLTSKAWAYMSAGATDMHTLDLNRKSFNWIMFRPRVMVDVDVVDTSTEMLGHKTSLPIFLCPTGMAGLAHPQGERLLSAGAGDCDSIYMVSTNASAPLDDIISSKVRADQPLFMQLYVDRNRSKTEALLKKINGLGLKAIFVTVDAAAPGKREADERSRAEVELVLRPYLLKSSALTGEGADSQQSGVSGGKIASDTKGGGIGRSVGGFIDPKLSWDDIAWLRKHTDLPIGLKGVQCLEDVMKAAELGVDAIYLSNHGGRALDTAPPALYTLLEVHKHCPEIMKKCEFYIDGGVRRGTDVVKAVCLGAKGVGLGRPFLYSLTYGKEGVIHGIEILRDEIETTMRLLGVTNISQLGPHLLNTKALDSQISDGPSWGPNEKRLGEQFSKH